MENFFSRLFNDPWETITGRESWMTPRLDIAESEDEVSLRAELPGVRTEDIHIDVIGDLLTLRGEKKEEKREKGDDFHYRETEYGLFSRTVQLPTGVDPDNVKAVCTNGILNITLKKKPEAKPRRITIEDGNGGSARGRSKEGAATGEHDARDLSRPDVPTVSRDELQDRLRKGDVQLVNVLEPEHFHLGMIHGSIRIPASELEERRHELDQFKPVVTYCAGPKCPASSKGAEILLRHGFNVRAYEGGIEDWKAAGLPMESQSSGKE